MTSRSDDPGSLRSEVFARVFEENWAAVRHHIECVVDDDSEVTELVSEVFLTAWSKLKPHRPLGRTWLLRVADRALRRRWGRIADRPAVTEAVHAGVSADRDGGDPATHVEILRALSGLNVRERRIIMLTYWDGLTAGEIVESMGVSRSCADRIYRRAHAKLRRGLGLEGASVATDH
jgi:RNA polymerase sigma factor (sigma-70 family)